MFILGVGLSRGYKSPVGLVCHTKALLGNPPTVARNMKKKNTPPFVEEIRGGGVLCGMKLK